MTDYTTTGLICSRLLLFSYPKTICLLLNYEALVALVIVRSYWGGEACRLPTAWLKSPEESPVCTYYSGYTAESMLFRH